MSRMIETREMQTAGVDSPTELPTVPARGDGESEAAKKLALSVGIPIEVARRGREMAQGREAVRLAMNSGKLAHAGDNPAAAQVRTTGCWSGAFSSELVRQIRLATVRESLEPKKLENDLDAANAIFGFMHEMQPKSPAEALLLSQAGVLQHHFAKAMTFAAGSITQPEHYQTYIKQGIALARACAAVLTAFQGLRGEASQQQVVVERVNVEAGGIGVGIVANPREGGAQS